MLIRNHVVRWSFFFFFSSRRRHTRCSRDWSSDVCSSDLPITRRRALLASGAAVAVASSPGSARAAVDKALVKKIERRAVGAATLDELRKMVDRKSVV